MGAAAAVATRYYDTKPRPSNGGVFFVNEHGTKTVTLFKKSATILKNFKDLALTIG